MPGRNRPVFQLVRVPPLPKLDRSLTLILLMLCGVGSLPANGQLLGLGPKPTPVVIPDPAAATS